MSERWYKTEPRMNREYAETFEVYLQVVANWLRVQWMIGTGRWDGF